MLILEVSKRFIKKRIARKSKDCVSEMVTGQASNPYNKMGQHLLATNSRTTSAEAYRPTLPKIAFSAL